MSSLGAAGRAEAQRRLARLRADRELLGQQHSYLVYDLDSANATAVARGAIPMLLPDGEVDPIEIELEFHRSYPARPPFVRETGGRYEPDDDRHIASDTNFCLYLRGVDEPDLRSPSALQVFMLDVICFLEQQLIYERTGRFPGPQWPHHSDAYALYIIEQLNETPDAAERIWEVIRGGAPSRNDSCPCGCGAKYKKCHLDLATELARIAGRYGLGKFDYRALREYAGAAA